MYNSTIKPKTGLCCLCPPNKGEQPLIAGKCNYHYWLNSKLKSAAKQQEKEVKSEGLSDLISDLDNLVSQYVRYSAVEEDGLVSCYTCSNRLPPAQIQAGHFIPRGCMYLRFDIKRNLRPQCEGCNCFRKGEYVKFGIRLNQEMPNIVDILEEEKNIIYKWLPSELKQLISEYSQKVKLLK